MSVPNFRGPYAHPYIVLLRKLPFLNYLRQDNLKPTIKINWHSKDLWQWLMFNKEEKIQLISGKRMCYLKHRRLL